MKNATILGAICGDTIGSIYEFHPTKDYDFEMFSDRMEYTDDSILTIAVADWILHDTELSHETLIESMLKHGRRRLHPMGEYGPGFFAWLRGNEQKPYGSFGNGSAMRVSAVGFAFDSIEKTMEVAKISAEITHNHPEGIKGAQAAAVAIYLARTGSTKQEIKEYIENKFAYNLHRTCDEIRPSYRFDGTCQGSVPESLIAFFDSNNYEDAIRLSISLGGDADTMASITGAVAASYYKDIPDKIIDFVLEKLPPYYKEVVEEFEGKFGK